MIASLTVDIMIRSVKGGNFLIALVEVSGMRLPCCVEFIKKDRWVRDALKLVNKNAKAVVP